MIKRELDTGKPRSWKLWTSGLQLVASKQTNLATLGTMWSELPQLEFISDHSALWEEILTRFTAVGCSEIFDLTIGKQLLMQFKKKKKKMAESFKLETARQGSFVPCGKYYQNSLSP